MADRRKQRGAPHREVRGSDQAVDLAVVPYRQQHSLLGRFLGVCAVGEDVEEEGRKRLVAG